MRAFHSATQEFKIDLDDFHEHFGPPNLYSAILHKAGDLTPNQLQDFTFNIIALLNVRIAKRWISLAHGGQ
jgi:hypothetical protein